MVKFRELAQPSDEPVPTGADQLQGSLEFLDPTTQEVLGSVELSQIGIFSLQMDRQAANTDAVSRYVAELYVEKMALNLKFV